MKIVSYLSKVRREKHLEWMIFDAFLVIVLIVLGFSAKPAYRAFREHRINANLAAATTAASDEDWGTARDKARSVLVARGQDFEAFRIWTRALGKLGTPSTYLALAAIFTDPRATRDDLLEALRVMALQAPQAVALSAYASLPVEFRDQAAFRAALTPLLIQRGEIDLAERCLREVAQPEDEPAVRLALLHALCSRTQAPRVAEARRILADLIAAKADKEALAALLILGATPGGLAPDEVLPELPEWLKNQPQATALHHLLGMNQALEARPESAERLYAGAIRRFLASNPGELGTWLVSHGQAAQAATLLEQPATTRADAYLARLHALQRLDQTAELMAALAAPPASVDLIEFEIMQANVAAKNGDLIASDAAWTRALNHAAFDTSRNRCLEIARAAEASGAKAAAENAWVAAVRLGWGQVPPYDDLLPVFASLLAKGRSDDLLAMFRMLLRFEPRNPELLHNAYYMGLIHGLLTPNQVTTVLVPLVERLDKPVYHSTLMLAEMLDGRPADALARLPRFRDSTGVAPMMKAALEGTARVLVGETEAGTALLKEVVWHGFMRQECIVFRNLLVQFKSSGLPMPELVSPNVEANPDQVPAWRKAVERLEKDRAGEVLPALPTPHIPGADRPTKPPENP
ncbi:MAG: hypothetical protein NTW21_18880 [Verrucomicrobia bacterium]|nr:hypothetical protein [Verrucomicrobiota bacterium]